MTLDMLEVDKVGMVERIDEKLSIYQRLMDIGMINGTCVKCVLKSPFGNPKGFLIRGAVIAIRNEDSKFISIVEE